METLGLWTHALAAFLFGALALWATRVPELGLPRWPLAAALGALALWALAVAGLGGADPAARFADGLRGLALIGLMAAIQWQNDRRAPMTVATIYGVIGGIVVVATTLQLVAVAARSGHGVAQIANAAFLFRMMVGLAALVLVQTLASAGKRADVRLACVALALVWLAQVATATTGYLGFAATPGIEAVRGLVIVAAAAPFAIALQRGGPGAIQVSRTVAYRSLSLAAVGVFLMVVVLITGALSAIGGAHARIVQTAFVFGSTAAALTLVGTPWLRAWVRVKIAKHLFRHRYDYRAEWIRFTGTLGAPEHAAPLDERIVKAVAEMTESPAGLLLVPEGDGLGIGAGWNWPHASPVGAGADFARHLAENDRIVELDPLRRGAGDHQELASVPQWMLDDADGWAVVPLPHCGRLVGAILLARPTVNRALDWEDFDLLRIAGRQVATYLAEARAQDALSQGERFDEFNRRFAFIVHDIKNLVSGLSLLARNAERHADNPAFRADMVATLQDSAAKLNALLARLSAGHRAVPEAAETIELLPVAERVAAAHRPTHAVVVSGARDAIAFADPARVEQVLGHLVRNAIEASAATEPVSITVTGGDAPTIEVADRGCGMSPAFLRDQLFRPFASSKPGGFGIGAFEARQLTQAMGGRIEVESREGEGTRFRVILPPARGAALQVAA